MEALNLNRRDLSNRLKYDPTFKYTVGDHTTSLEVLQSFRRFYETIPNLLDMNTWMSVYAPHLLVENLDELKKYCGHSSAGYHYKLFSLGEGIHRDLRVFSKIFNKFHQNHSRDDWKHNQPFISAMVKQPVTFNECVKRDGASCDFFALLPVVSFTTRGFSVSFIHDSFWFLGTDQHIPANLFDILPSLERYEDGSPYRDTYSFATRYNTDYPTCSYRFSNDLFLYTFYAHLNHYNKIQEVLNG